MQGYLHSLYAKSFSEIGEPVFLPESRGWLIKRPIPGTPYFDAMGPYPLFLCENWEKLIDDLEKLKHDLISVTLVIPPLVQFPMEEFHNYFDRFIPYKDHYLLDLTLPLDQVISKGRRKDARRALRNLVVDVVSAPDIDPLEWYGLYQNLVSRHDIKGIRAFSENSFRSQVSIPGMHFFRAFFEGRLVGGSLYQEQDSVVYFHLSAFYDEGYDLDAAYAVKWTALQYFSSKVRWMNLGGSTTSASGEFSGLDRFKKGWSNETAKSFFCGKILNPALYAEIAEKRFSSAASWFPAYRAGDY